MAFAERLDALERTKLINRSAVRHVHRQPLPLQQNLCMIRQCLVDQYMDQLTLSSKHEKLCAQRREASRPIRALADGYGDFSP
jgi:hypothetical protein